MNAIAEQAYRLRLGMQRILASRLAAQRPVAATAVLCGGVSEDALAMSLPAFPFEDETDV